MSINEIDEIACYHFFILLAQSEQVKKWRRSSDKKWIDDTTGSLYKKI